ncbi:MAG: Gfo/Idh/MocA family oxidoreductase, partial [Acidimicrobiia bacterium]
MTSRPRPTPRIGVVGAGWWACGAHLPSLQTYEGAELVGLVDPDEEKSARVAEHFQVKRTFSSIEGLLDAGADGVVISAPHDLHYDLARKALDRGVHVFVEKPMVLTGEHAWDLVRRAEAQNLHLTVGYTFQHTSHARLAREWVARGEIGDLQLVSATYASVVEAFLRGQPDAYNNTLFEYQVHGPSSDTYSRPERGGGQAYTQITHAMGMAFWVTDERATRVAGFMSSAGLDVDLADAASYELASGAIGTIASTGGLAPGQQQNQVIDYYGSAGVIHQDLLNGVLRLQRTDGLVTEAPVLEGYDIYPIQLPVRRFA